MKMALIENTLLIKEADTVQFAVIKSWGKMKWSKTTQTLSGTADIELLDKLSSIVKLPPHIEALRQSLHDTAAAVDQERMNDSPEPLLDYPVKMLSSPCGDKLQLQNCPKKKLFSCVF